MKQVDIPSESCKQEDVLSSFGKYVFTDNIMRERLPKKIYQSLRRSIEEGLAIDPSIADVVANAMKDWALGFGATHYSHWFQPMTGQTAEKQDAFITPDLNGHVIMEFSGKSLTMGEPDASSFPSGGLRATFEARGYTAWDCTSPVFVKKDGENVSLAIPSFFCSYNGETLDKKMPLLRSMDVVNKQAVRMLRILGNTTTHRVYPTMGGEQEYFLIDRKYYEQRIDLQLTGRTLFGAPAPKGQEMEDHYFGNLHERVATFMDDLNRTLWHLGIGAKTQHNEVAPSQYEIAPLFETVNVAVDHNQMTMETMQKVARRHNFVCLLHEKPFAGVNGSGKHNNWSLLTDDGQNLLNPGESPHENMKFLVFLFAVIRAVDKYASLLRCTVASAGNDHRLGANEAPPAIISIFLGDQLNDIFQQIKNGGVKGSKHAGLLQLGVNTLPPLPQDCTDRNRTSPFAFTGNKFEFRMPGSSQSLSGPNYVLNAIVADVLSEMSDELEKFAGKPTLPAQVQKLLNSYAKKHERIIFNGDNYSDTWVREAEKRGLPNLKDTVESIERFLDPENATVLARYGVLSPEEMRARYEILMEQYAKTINIEAEASIYMAKRQFLPTLTNYAGKLAKSVNAMVQCGFNNNAMIERLGKVSGGIETISQRIDTLVDAHAKAESKKGTAAAYDYRDKVIPAMNALREVVDDMESIIDSTLWPLPTYADMMFKK
ncbi:MAG: glutamine synthetase III [Candidatus Sumerlaeales bacterium]|nr:glutamine synthetase III [Candidatus Sumerlaeales bacterium]